MQSSLDEDDFPALEEGFTADCPLEFSVKEPFKRLAFLWIQFLLTFGKAIARRFPSITLIDCVNDHGVGVAINTPVK